MKRDLGPGFWRAPNGSLRVLIRVKGFPPAVRTFKLLSDTPEGRKDQRVAAEAWAAHTRKLLYAGHSLVAQQTDLTLGQALKWYVSEGLVGRPLNRRKDELRVERILTHPIAERRVTSISLVDLAAYRDFLIDQDYVRRINRTPPAAAAWR